MKHIINFSGGDCSFWAAHRVIEKFGPQNVIPLFADTLEEDEDLYAFVAKSSSILGVPITRVSREIKIWELFRREGLIGNNRFPICSVYLKRELLDEFMLTHFEMNCDQQNAFMEHATCYVGFDWTEPHRLEDMRNAHPTWKVEAPMQWEPIWDKCKMRVEADKLGLPQQRLYKAGFPHNNCGGKCVRAGISHWVHLNDVFPERFDDWANEEQITIADFKRRGISSDEWTILKDRRGGKAKPLSLKSLKERILAGEKFSKQDWGGCGCGGATPKPAEPVCEHCGKTDPYCSCYP